MSWPRLLAIMGSGETTPTMVKVHRGLLDRLGPGARAVLLDTPYGFQENADDISARAVEYFARSVGRPMAVASWRRPDDDAVTRETALSAIRDAAYVFAGPGSPTYALAQWRGSALPGLLADKLTGGGCVTFASAAALTLGVVTVPVYEIYKVGQAPAWEQGLDLLSAIGLRVAVIPHFDNAEGGNHDTRYCYLGERRLRVLEAQLPEDAFVLGVDEHTACLVDPDAGSVSVVGHGVVTVRVRGESWTHPAGTTVALTALATGSARSTGSAGAAKAAPQLPVDALAPATGLLAEAERQAARFDAAVARADVDDAVGAVLDLEQAFVDWSGDTLQSDEADRARALLRHLVVRLGELARSGVKDPADVVGPFVEALLDARRAARAAGDFNAADGLRDRLLDAGIEVRDTPDGTTWSVRDRGLLT